MSSTASNPSPLPTHLDIPDERVHWGRIWTMVGLCVLTAVGFQAWKTGYLQPSRLWSRPPATLTTVTVDQGTMADVVVENGTLESANNATIRCKVEALIGMVGGAGQPGGAPAGTGGGRGQGGQGGQGGMGGQPGGAQQPSGQQQQQQQSATKKKAQAKSGASAKKDPSAGSAALVTGGAAAPGGTAAPDAGGGGGGGGKGGGGGGGGGSTTTAGTAAPAPNKPVIKSFTYVVPPYMPLRPKPQAPPQSILKPAPPMPQGGGRGRGGGGRNADPNNQEKPGATRIISILPEGTRVRAGDIVAELDSSAFRDEVQAQQIRYLQAKSLVDQAKSILAVNEITLKEYRDGIFPQDVQLVRQYLNTCEVDVDRARRNLEWSKATAAKGFRTQAQVKADVAGLEQALIAAREARGMILRLEKFTGPRLIKNLMAKIEAIKADKLAQDSVFQLETDRLRRLQETVANCTLRAPRDGIVVYANQTNSRSGRVDVQIDEGVTVRQGQAIINLPDPKHMQVRARINESKVSSIQPGQQAEIIVDAFPNRLLIGTVESVTPIPAPSTMGGQDVRIYYAVVEIDSGGFDELRPGLSAQVSFLIDRPRSVTRVPLEAVRWVDEVPYVAVARNAPEGPSWRWASPTLGRSDLNYIEIVSGLKPGDRVVARPDLLAAPRRSPTPARARPGGNSVAEARPASPRG